MAGWHIPPGDALALPLHRPWHVPPGDALALPLGPTDDPTPPDPDPPSSRHDLHCAISAPWSHAPRRLRTIRAGWAKNARRSAAARANWTHAPPQTRTAALPWQRTPQRRSHVVLHWQSVTRRLRPSAALPWRGIPRTRLTVAMPWSMPPQAQAAATLPWTNPPRAVTSAALPWSMPARITIAPHMPWSAPPLHNPRWLLPWGYAPRVAWAVRSPGVTPPAPPLPPGNWHVPPGDALPLPLLCRWHVPPGDALPLPIGPFACPAAAGGTTRRYIVLNSAHVVRLPERTPVDVDSIRIRMTVDDPAHAITMTLANPDDLALLISDDSPREVEININGHVWTGIIESHDITTEYPGRSVSVSGRSRAALLSADYAPTRTHTQQTDAQAQQLIDAELDLTGFTADYDTITWLVPASAWSYHAQAPLSAISMIAAASGAVVQSHPWDKTLHIRPRYPVSPWQWATSPADKHVIDDYVPSHSTRDTTTGVPIYQITLPLWPPTTPQRPGLVMPLQLVEFTHAAGTRRGQCYSVEIDARMTQKSTAAVLVVDQTIELECQPAAPRYNYVLVSGQQVGVSDPIIRDGTAGNARMAMIVDPLITDHAASLERGRNALAAGADHAARSNLWQQLLGTIPGTRQTKGNITAHNPDGSYTIATTDGTTIRARPHPGDTWTTGQGVLVTDNRITDTAPDLPGITQYT